MKARPFFVVVAFLFVLLVIASGSVSDTDLTPYDPPVVATPYDNIQPLTAPVSGSRCYTPYTVQSGDTLSKIASACGVNLNELRAANPELADPNLIHPGQLLRIPSGAQPGSNPLADIAATAAAQQQASAPGWNPSGKPAEPASAGVLATGGQETAAVPMAVTAPSAADAGAVQAVPTGEPIPLEIPGSKVGDQVSVEIKNLPAGANFRLEQGTSAGRRMQLGNGLSDPSGVVRLVVVIPPEARPGQQWYVFATHLVDFGQEYRSDPIEIGGRPE